MVLDIRHAGKFFQGSREKKQGAAEGNPPVCLPARRRAATGIHPSVCPPEDAPQQGIHPSVCPPKDALQQGIHPSVCPPGDAPQQGIHPSVCLLKDAPQQGIHPSVCPPEDAPQQGINPSHSLLEEALDSVVAALDFEGNWEGVKEGAVKWSEERDQKAIEEKIERLADLPQRQFRLCQGWGNEKQTTVTAVYQYLSQMNLTYGSQFVAQRGDRFVPEDVDCKEIPWKIVRQLGEGGWGKTFNVKEGVFLYGGKEGALKVLRCTSLLQ